MSRGSRLGTAVLCLCFISATPAGAQGVRLPIANGVWVKTGDACGAATNVFVNLAGRFGSLYFYGTGYSMGPADETEALTRTSPGADGFTIVNTGPLQVAARPNGQAQVRAVSASDGVAWVETVKLCAAPTLLPRLRQALVRLRYLPG